MGISNYTMDKSLNTVQPGPETPWRVGEQIAVALLTGGADQPYAYGLGTALIPRVQALDVIGNDELDCPDFHGKPGVAFLNLRGQQRPDASFGRKISRMLVYYARLIRYAAASKPKIFHILWNNKFETFDRTLLMLYYLLLGKKIVLTVHNVNTRRRDANDTLLNRATLRIQYQLAAHLFVHTEQMKTELMEEFGVEAGRVTVIPFGINNATPNTGLTPSDARKRLSLREGEKTILFFGHITPYKGLEYLVDACRQIAGRQGGYRLIVAGRPKNCEAYWRPIRESLHEDIRTGRVLLRDEFIPDEETEVYFKAADVLVLPYKHIYQSGVLFLGHSFGLPALVADVGSLKDDIVEGKTGSVFKPEDSGDLAKAIESYFASDLYRTLNHRRREIRESALERHSWEVVGEMTMSVYETLLRPSLQGRSLDPTASKASFDIKPPL